MLDVRNIKMLNMCKLVIWETEEDDNEIKSLALIEASGCIHYPCFTEKETQNANDLFMVSELGQARPTFLTW